jgi:hypothetical protein
VIRRGHPARGAKLSQASEVPFCGARKFGVHETPFQMRSPIFCGLAMVAGKRGVVIIPEKFRGRAAATGAV